MRKDKEKGHSWKVNTGGKRHASTGAHDDAAKSTLFCRAPCTFLYRSELTLMYMLLTLLKCKALHISKHFTEVSKNCVHFTDGRK